MPNKEAAKIPKEKLANALDYTLVSSSHSGLDDFSRSRIESKSNRLYRFQTNVQSESKLNETCFKLVPKLPSFPDQYISLLTPFKTR